MERLARPGAVARARRRICSPVTSTAAEALFAESSAAAADYGNADMRILERVRARAAGDGPRPVDGGGRASGGGARRHRRAPDARLRRGPARPSPARPGSPCTGATWTRRTASSRGRCEPARRARSCCRSSPCACGCSSPRCTGPWATTTTARHLLREIDDILLHRPALGVLVDEVAELRRVLSVERAGGRDRRVAAHPGGASAAARTCRRTSRSARSRERLFVSRNTVSTEVGSIYRKLGRLVTQRRGGAGDRDRSARRVAEITRPALAVSRASSVSYPSASASFGAAATTHGEPDDGNDADEHVDDLGGRRPCTHRGVGLGAVGRHRATDRDQRGEADQRQRLRIELGGARPRLRRTASSARRASLIARRRSRSV